MSEPHAAPPFTSNPIFASALAYLRAGFSIFHIEQGSNKKTTFHWGHLRDKPLSEAEAGRIWGRKANIPGIALICGRASGGLVLLDFDNHAEEVYPVFCQAIQAEAPGLLDRVAQIKSPRGYHLWFRWAVASAPASTVLASDPKQPPGQQVITETRGEGGYGLAPGSPPECHKLGLPYTPIGGTDLVNLRPISEAEGKLLLQRARAWDLRRPTPPAQPKGTTCFRPGEDFDRNGPPWADILTPHGWVLVGGYGAVQHWQRPNKNEPGVSATTGYCKGKSGEDLLRVFSTNAAPLEGGKAYGKFRTVAMLCYAGNLSACAKQLRADGWGGKPPSPPTGSAPPPPQPPPSEGGKGGGGAAGLVRAILEAGAHLFRADDGMPYVRQKVDGISRVYSLPSLGYAYHIREVAWRLTGETIGAASIETTMQTLCSLAAKTPNAEPVYLRVGHRDDKAYIDLGDERYQAIEIDAQGWRIQPTAPVNFIRRRGMTALPVPQQGGSINLLDRYLNVSDPLQKLLVHAWLLSALRDGTDYPLLVLSGRQHTGKSMAARILRSLVDPSSSPLRAPPEKEHDLAIAARNSWVLNIDNVENIGQSMSAALCRLSTGGAFATRALYSNDEEAVLNACRPVVLNGIGSVAERPDLLSRCLLVELQPMPEELRRSRHDLLREFELEAPLILGALLNALVTATANRGKAEGPFQSRFPGFEQLAIEAGPSFGWGAADVREAIEANQQTAGETAIAADALVGPIEAVLSANQGKWQGTATELLAALAGQAGSEVTKKGSWPKTASCLSKRLDALATPLEQSGIKVDHDRARKARTRLVILTRTATSTASNPFADPPEQPPPGDFSKERM